MIRGRSERRGYEKILYEQHVERVRHMKGTVDVGPPRVHPLGNKGELDKVFFIELDQELEIYLFS